MAEDTIGQRLQSERKRLGFTQDRMAELGGVKKNTQFKYEADRSRPDAEYLQRLAELGLDIVYLLRGVRGGASQFYEGPGDALQTVLAAQAELGLSFSSEQLKTLLEYTYKNHIDQGGVQEFVKAVYEVAGKPLQGEKTND